MTVRWESRDADGIRSGDCHHVMNRISQLREGVNLRDMRKFARLADSGSSR